MSIALASNNGSGTKVLTIAQSPQTVLGLYPGDAPIALDLTLGDPNAVDVNITSLVGTVTSVDKPGCAAGNVTIAQLPASAYPFKIKAGQTVSQTLHIQMGKTTPDACRGATFTISYSAAGTGA